MPAPPSCPGRSTPISCRSGRSSCSVEGLAITSAGGGCSWSGSPSSPSPLSRAPRPRPCLGCWPAAACKGWVRRCSCRTASRSLAPRSPARREGGRIGTWAAAGALAGALGPLIGGWLIDTTGWRTIFLLNLPIAAAAGYLAWAYVPETKDGPGAMSLDWAGAMLATLSLALLTWSLTAASAAGAAPTLLWTVAAAGLAMLGGFLWLEAKRGDRAIMPFALFATPTFIGLTLLSFFLYASLGGLLVLLPYLLIRIDGYSAVAAGAAMLPLPILIGLGSPLMGRLTARYGGRLLLTVGAAVVAAGFALYRRVETGGFDYWTHILPATLLVASGMGVSVAPLTATVMTSVDPDHAGAASGLNSAVARIAGLIATALLGLVFAQEGSDDAFIAGFHVAVLVGAGSAAVAAGCAILLIRPP